MRRATLTPRSMPKVEHKSANGRWRMRAFPLLLVLILAHGCGSRSPFTRTGPPRAARPAAAHVEAFLGERRPAAYEELGVLEIGGGWSGSLGEATEFAKSCARENGGDCVIYVSSRSEQYSTPDPVFGGHTVGTSTRFRFIIGRLTGGATTTAQVRPGSSFCVACGAALQPAGKFCAGCGAKAGEGQRVASVEPSPPDTTGAPAAYCSCGAALYASSKWCGTCGKTVPK